MKAGMAALKSCRANNWAQSSAQARPPLWLHSFLGLSAVSQQLF